jgi:hypothetical protein
LDRRPREEGQLLLLAQFDQRVGPAVAQVVTVLDGDDRGEALGPTQLLLGDVGEAEVADLALLSELDKGADGLLQWHRGVGAVLNAILFLLVGLQLHPILNG